MATEIGDEIGDIHRLLPYLVDVPDLLIDESPNRRNGSISGATATGGRIGNALDFTRASNDNVLLDNLPLGNEFSISYWITPNEGYGIATSVAYMLRQSVQYIHDSISSSLGKNTLILSTSAGSFQVSLSSDIALGQWEHHVVTYDGAELKLYRGGVLEASAPATGTPVLANTLSALGAGSYVELGGGAANPAQVKVDQFRLFNRAITAAEVSQLYGRGFDVLAVMGGWNIERRVG